MRKHGSRFIVCLLLLFAAARCRTTPPEVTPDSSLTGKTGSTAATASATDTCKTALGAPGPGEYEVVITLSGIGLFDRRNPGVIKVRMPNATAGRPEITDPDTGALLREEIEPHIAYILAGTATMKPLIDGGVSLKAAENEGTCYKYYQLDGHVIKVDEASAPMTINPPLCLSDASDADLCPTTTTEGSMRWLPSMTTIRGGVTPPQKTDHFEDDPHPSVLSGLVHIDRGYLDTAVMRHVVWAFRSPTNPTEFNPQAIAQEVRWHMRGKGTHFILRLKRRGETEIQLPFAPVNGRVELFIANSPPKYTGPIRNPTIAHDHHFSLYYEFIDGFDWKTSRVPHESLSSNCGTAIPSTERPTLQVCVPGCTDPSCPPPPCPGCLPSGLNCGGTNWP